MCLIWLVKAISSEAGPVLVTVTILDKVGSYDLKHSDCYKGNLRCQNFHCCKSLRLNPLYSIVVRVIAGRMVWVPLAQTKVIICYGVRYLLRLRLIHLNFHLLFR